MVKVTATCVDDTAARTEGVGATAGEQGHHAEASPSSHRSIPSGDRTPARELWDFDYVWERYVRNRSGAGALRPANSLWNALGRIEARGTAARERCASLAYGLSHRLPRREQGSWPRCAALVASCVSSAPIELSGRRTDPRGSRLLGRRDLVREYTWLSWRSQASGSSASATWAAIGQFADAARRVDGYSLAGQQAAPLAESRLTSSPRSGGLPRHEIKHRSVGDAIEGPTLTAMRTLARTPCSGCWRGTTSAESREERDDRQGRPERQWVEVGGKLFRGTAVHAARLATTRVGTESRRTSRSGPRIATLPAIRTAIICGQVSPLESPDARRRGIAPSSRATRTSTTTIGASGSRGALFDAWQRPRERCGRAATAVRCRFGIASRQLAGPARSRRGLEPRRTSRRPRHPGVGLLVHPDRPECLQVGRDAAAAHTRRRPADVLGAERGRRLPHPGDRRSEVQV